MFPRLADRIDQLAGNLSGGEQQMLAVSQALIPDPQMLLIDELSLGLAPTIVGQLIEVVHQIHETGLTIVVVEQSINVALRLAQRRSEEHTSELQSLMRISYAVFCLKKKKKTK